MLQKLMHDLFVFHLTAIYIENPTKMIIFCLGLERFYCFIIILVYWFACVSDCRGRGNHPQFPRGPHQLPTGQVGRAGGTGSRHIDDVDRVFKGTILALCRGKLSELVTY